MNTTSWPAPACVRRPAPFPRRLLALALCALCAWLLPAAARAQTCWINSSPTLSFGSANASGATGNGTLTFICNNYTHATLSHRVCLTMNPNTPGGVAPRRMINWSVTPNAYLDYDLYANPSHTQLLGADGSGHPVFSTVLTMTADGQASGSMQIHARLPAGQTVAAGNYVSQITSVLRFASQAGGTAPSPEQCAASGSASTHYTEVRTSFANSCYISTATDLDFGTVTRLSSAREQTSAISLHCPAGTAWRVALDNGSHASGGNRRMAGPGGHIGYELYRDSARTQAWSTSPNDRTGTGDNSVQTLVVYGRVPAQAVAAPGTYSDTVTVTLTY
ncbi:Csu type fimbrial protein [Pseudoxanthomonas jiangsuensis]|uniref:Csu type fimbrial protein n=1 Tax=Pseudoxanthomonas jiangsuensis TaxID=619688 RepID=UPI001391769D|nr:spore coat protein U domain-containing protein [Pseudoxanthomonas jiangsuensis]